MENRNLDKGSLIPLYHQLKEQLRERVLDGTWKSHEAIPSERELMEEYGISRATVRQALLELVNEGLLYRVQGRGTFVAEPKIEQGLTRFYSFTDEMIRKGRTPSSRILACETVPATSVVARRLGIAPGEMVHRLDRLRLVDDSPVMLESSYLPVSMIPELPGDQVAAHSLYGYLRKEYKIHVTRARESFEPIVVDADQAALLEVSAGSPALLLERTAHMSSDEQPAVEYCRSIVRGDKCRFYVDLISDDAIA